MIRKRKQQNPWAEFYDKQMNRMKGGIAVWTNNLMDLSELQCESKERYATCLRIHLLISLFSRYVFSEAAGNHGVLS